MAETKKTYGLGWLPDIPDVRDFTPGHEEIRKIFKSPLKAKKLPESIDLREWCSPVEDQGNLGSCTANAVLGLVEYMQKKINGEYLDSSRRFLYKVTRKLYGLTGDTGAFIRGTIRALRIFGACPEKYWPYEVSHFDEEPSSFCYAFAQAYQAIKYFRLADPDPEKLLEKLRLYLSKGLPLAFGFTVYSSIFEEKVTKTGDIPFPRPGDKAEGGHAIMAVGYNDKKKVLLIRNSWGASWGDKGYGTLPYDYVLQALADDFWVITSLEYVSLLGI